MKKATIKVDFRLFIRKGSISTVSLIPPLIAFLLIVLWIALKGRFFPDAPEFFNSVILSIASLIIGCVGLIYVYRREMPGPISSITVKGKSAVIVGLIVLLFFWGLGITGLFFALS